MTRIAYLDCLSGISGDMTLGALIDLGVDAAAIEAALRSMGIPQLSLTATPVKKCGFRAIKVDITHPPEHAHRHLHHITEMIDRASEISPNAKERARHIFTCLAEAEAKVHGSTIAKVHFHEVGAIDSIADIVGAAIAFDALGIERVIASPVPTGYGSITIAHGRVSIPAPATAELLREIPLLASDVEAELTTPTGAAILKATVASYGSLPDMRLLAVGYGAGSKDLPGQANVLRVMLGQVDDHSETTSTVESDQVIVLETNVDDSTPQQLADCAERLLASGALDVFQVPCVMKKGRAAALLTVVCAASRVRLLESIIFEHSSSIGVRRYTANRRKLIRETVTVETLYGPVRGKVVTLPSGERRFRTEDDEARTVAAANGLSADVVREQALQSWREFASKRGDELG